MNEREALMLVQQVTSQTGDRQLSQLDEMMKANLAEQLVNLSQIVDVNRIDREDLLKILLYTDHQRQSGFMDAMNGQGGQRPPMPNAGGPRIGNQQPMGRPAIEGGARMEPRRHGPMMGGRRRPNLRDSAEDVDL